MHYLELYRFKFGESVCDGERNFILKSLKNTNQTIDKFGYRYWLTDVNKAIKFAIRNTIYFSIEKVTFDVSHDFYVRQINVETIITW